MVTLASGLDCRCLRLACLDETIEHYLIDQPDMVDHVKRVVPELEQKPSIHYIGVKFGEEKWWDMLEASGFDRNKKSLFLMEGLVMYLQESEIDENLENISSLMCNGSIISGDYTLEGFISHPLMSGLMDTLERWKCKWTYGPTSYHKWQEKLHKENFTILEDKDLLNSAGRLLTWIRDNYMPWIPNYRVYTACKGGSVGDFNDAVNKRRFTNAKVKPLVHT